VFGKRRGKRRASFADEGADFIFDTPIELSAAVEGIRYAPRIPGAGPDPWGILESE